MRRIVVAVPLSTHEHIYDDENVSTTPSTVAGGEADQESDTTLALPGMPNVHPCKNIVTWNTVLSPSTESSSSNVYHERYVFEKFFELESLSPKRGIRNTIFHFWGQQLTFRAIDPLFLEH